MPVIAIANPKGGAGKSTTSLVLGTFLSSQGATVQILDTDVQRTVGKWSEGNSKYKEIVLSITEPKELISTIDQASEKFQFVIIDIQGRAAMTMARAMSRADLVIIPMQAKAADAEEAVTAIQLVRDEEEVLRRKLDHRILFMRTNSAIPTREEKEIIESMSRVGVPSFKTHLNERTAFSRMISYRLALDELDTNQVNGVPAAIDNAAKLVSEVIEIFTGN